MNRKRGYWIIAACCAILAIAGYNAAIRDWGDTESNFVGNLILGIVCTGFSIFFLIKKQKEKVNASTSPHFVQQNIRRVSSIPSIEERVNEVGMLTELPVITSPHSIVLKPGEVCHYQSNAAVLLVKNEVVGHTRGHSGVSVRVAKGLTLHSGGSRGQAIRQDVAHRYPGLFTMTNQRIIMTGEKGFDQPVGKLTSITPYNGFQGITLQFGRSSYTILMAEPFWVPKIIELLHT